MATKAAEAQLKHSRTKAVNIRERQCNGIATAVNSSALSHGKRLTPSQIPAGTASSALHKGRHVFELCRQVFEPRGGGGIVPRRARSGDGGAAAHATQCTHEVSEGACVSVLGREAGRGSIGREHLLGGPY